MRKAIVITTSLLMICLMIVSACAISFPSGLSGLSSLGSLGIPQTTSSLGSSGMPASNMEVSTPSTAFGNPNWALNGMNFFQPSSAQQSLKNIGGGTGIPASDVMPIMQMMSNLPTQDQMQQAAAATPTPTPAADVFTSVSSEIPADMVLVLEVTKNIVYIDATQSGFKVPEVTMNYQFDTNNKKLILKKKIGTDVSSAKIIVGYSRQDDRDGTYLFDYGIGSVPYDNIPIVFTGADGRVSITLNGTRKDLMPNEKAEQTTRGANTMTTITVANYGLVPKANIELKDKL